MPIPPIIKLTKGRRELNLVSIGTSGRYNADKFVPPDVNIAPLIATGTSANRRNGGKKVGERAMDREITLNMQIKNCDSEAEVNRALRDLRNFLSLAGDESEPLYLEFRPNNSVAAEPLWGNYGMNFRYEIIHASKVSVTDDYWLIWQDQGELPVSPITLTIKPYALGLKQRLASAIGGIRQDNWGTTDGISRGVIIQPAFTNKMTNPVFGSSTYSTGWTADASLTASQNVDPMYLLPETINSAKLISRSTNQRFYQSINVGGTASHNFQAIVKAVDGGTVSSSDCVLFYNAVLTTTFTSLGDGFWLLTATTAGINAATNTGVEVKNGRAIYLCAYLCIQASNAGGGLEYLPAWGDNLGASWTGTAHASTSSIVAGRIRLPVAVDTFEISQGTIRMIIKWPSVQTAINLDRYLFSCGSTSLRAFFQNSDDTLRFTDNTNTASAAITFSAGQIDVFDFAYSAVGGLVIYRNGVSFATNATYTPPALPSYVYWGTDDSAATHLRATIMEAATYGVALTAVEVLANYNNVLPLLTDGQRVGTLPYLWTKDGDDVVDNSDGSGTDNWCVIGGIPGSEAAETIIIGQTSADWLTMGNMWLSNINVDLNLFPLGSPAYFEYADLSGTVVANTVGGQVARTSLNTTEVSLGNLTINPGHGGLKQVLGKEYTILTRLADAGANLSISNGLRVSTGTTNLSEYRPVVGAATYYLFRTNPMIFPTASKLAIDDLSNPAFCAVELWAKRTVAGAANVDVDYLALLFRPYKRIIPNSATAENGFIYRSKTDEVNSGSAGVAPFLIGQGEPIRSEGDILELFPEQFNVLTAYMGKENSDPVITFTLTYIVLFTPRYSLQ